MTTEKKEECIELKNINYKNMLMNGTTLSVKDKNNNNIENLDKFLSDENDINKKDQWCKLNKTTKTQKLIEFVEKYKKEQNLTDEEEKLMITFFKTSLDKKRLHRVKDVVYDKVTGIIKDIPGLTFDKTNKHFTLKNLEKHHDNTLKSLTPKKINGTIKHQPSTSASASTPNPKKV